jgi:mono/diheme cytochrome c family protein
MPIWGELLTSEQLDALVGYALEAASGPSLEAGRQLFVENCAPCHGDFGEGGPNPTRPDDIIAPISSAEYLRTRDDATLRAVIAEGQPNFGMSPFGTAFGGPLDSADIDSIVSFIRAWEANPPVEVPPEVIPREIAATGAEIYAQVCAQCHAPDGAGQIGPSLRDPEFQARNTDQQIFDTINLGHPATPMIGWGEILTAKQIQELVEFIRTLAAEPSGAAGPPSFSEDVLPILQSACGVCHGTLGGWDASSYETVMNSGAHAPVVVPGRPEESLLARKLLGTQEEGTIMPPAGALPAHQIQIILDWIAAGARED